MSARTRLALGLMATAGLLAGCGSGGGSSEDSAQAAARSVSAALASATTSTETESAGSNATQVESSDAPSESASSVPDICTLLPAAKASSLVGAGYVAAESAARDTYHACSYRNDESKPQVSASTLVVDVDTKSGCWAGRQADIKLSNSVLKPVDGVGDAAFGYQNGLIVKYGDVCIGVAGETIAESRDDYTADIAIAKIVIAGLT